MANNLKMTRRIWIYTLGDGTAEWADLGHDLVLGWWMLGDLRRYRTRQELKSAIVGDDSEIIADCCWKFSRVMDEGDIVLVVRGTDTVMGLALVTGVYRYEIEREMNLGHRRRIEWIARGKRKDVCRFEEGRLLETLAEGDVRVEQVFAAYDRKPADADPSRFRNRVWWLATNVDYWSLDNEVAVGETFFYYKYNERGHVRTSGRAFDEMRAGDLVLGYVGGPVKNRGVHSLLRCEASLGCGEYEGAWRENVVVFRKIRELEPIIPWEVFRDDPVLITAHMVRVKNVGSLFGFTPEQRDEVWRILGLKCGILRKKETGRVE